MATTLLILYLMGRLPWCDCGYVKVWHAEAYTHETSQHLFDPYTLTHISHGIIFYFLAWVVFKKRTLTTRFLAALSVECAWEIFENTSFIINRYREATVSLDYFGDSIVNSLGDILAMIAGFAAVAFIPMGGAVMLFITLEILMALTIRDNLTLNIIMLLYPVDAIRQWQTVH